MEVRVQAWDSTDATLLSFMRGGAVRELMQILHHHLFARGETGTRPVRLYSKTTGRLLSEGDIVEPAPMTYRYSRESVSSAAVVGGCAGIHVLPDYAQIMPDLFDAKGFLPVRFLKPSPYGGTG
jgi:hypothetical protein